MRLYKTTITPVSNFATSLKGDTLFGQICWAIRFTFGEERLKELLGDYDTNPFLIVSDAFAVNHLPKPMVPSIYLNEDAGDKKINRKKVWLTLEDLQAGNFHQAKTDKEIQNIDTSMTIMHNAINYKTSTTGGGKGFDPYGENEKSLSQKDIYFLLRSDFLLEELKKTFELVSQMGYGKDSTIGKGRFRISTYEPINIDLDSSTYLALSPFVPYGLECQRIFYEPFTRFGKSGASRANTNPFKKPILLADSAAVIHFEERVKKQYLGKAISDISSYADTVHQGYSIIVPIKELSHEK